MVEISVEGDSVVFAVEGWDKLWALSSRLTIPAVHIRGARRATADDWHWFDSLRLAGTGVPGLFRAGTFLQKDGLVFWDVRHIESSIVIDLEHEHFKKLVVEVADPDGAVRMLVSTTGARSG